MEVGIAKSGKNYRTGLKTKDMKRSFAAEVERLELGAELHTALKLASTSGKTTMPHETVTIFTLRNGRELHIDTPDWYFKYTRNVTIRTPHSTHVIYNKTSNSNRPFTKDFLQKHYLSSEVNDDSSQLELDQLGIKLFGEELSQFEVLVTESAVEKYCDTYPPLTIVEDY